jgi:hypothetical protein
MGWGRRIHLPDEPGVAANGVVKRFDPVADVRRRKFVEPGRY